MAVPKLIILEGPDGAGKTTLANALAEKFDAQLIRHDAQPERNNMFPYFVESLKKVAENPGTYIFDRCWISEPIYGRVLRDGRDRVGTNNARALTRVALGFGAEMILCLPPVDVMLENFRRTREQQLPEREDQLIEIYNAYRREVLTHAGVAPYPVYAFNYMNLGSTQRIANSLSYAGSPPLQNYGPGIGRWKEGNTLVLGSAEDTRYNPDWVFVHDNGDAAWFNRQLELTGVAETDLYFVSVVEDGNWRNAQFVRYMKPGRVVAIGDKARMWCLHNAIPHYHISHPRYWRLIYGRRPYFELWYALGKAAEYEHKKSDKGK